MQYAAGRAEAPAGLLHSAPLLLLLLLLLLLTRLAADVKALVLGVMTYVDICRCAQGLLLLLPRFLLNAAESSRDDGGTATCVFYRHRSARVDSLMEQTESMCTVCGMWRRRGGICGSPKVFVVCHNRITKEAEK
jgi:hypothetical protein